jgi:hypothetical protein
MWTEPSEKSALPNELWTDILQHLPLETLWYSTRPVCSLFYDISTSIVKSALVDGSLCELRHYISFKEDLLSESLLCPIEHTEFERRILRREGHSGFSQILLWRSPVPSRVLPQRGCVSPTVNYKSADGKKCTTMAVFEEQSHASSSSAFHCRRMGCLLRDEKGGLNGGHVCLAGCWHVHYYPIDRIFCVTIPLATLFRISLRLERARRQRITERSYPLERKGRWNTYSRHGVSASLSPFAEIDNMLNSILVMSPIANESADEEEEDGPGTLFDEWSDDEEGHLVGLFE